MVSAYPLLLFGGDVTVLNTGGRVILSSDGGFIRFAVAGGERVALLIQELKAALDRLLHLKVNTPALQIGESPIVQTIIDLLSVC
jgi:hypothetical protein